MRRTDLLSSAGSQAATNEAATSRRAPRWQDVTPEGYFNRVRTLDLDSATGRRPTRWAAPMTIGR